MTIDALVHTTLELHSAIATKQLNAIDQKVQQIIRQYHVLKPENHEIQELYLKEGIALDLSDHEISPELQAKLRNLEAVIVKIVSSTAPDVELEKRIDRLDRFTKACTLPDVLWGTDFTILDAILKEGPIDFGAVSIPTSETSSLPLIAYVLKKSFNNKLLTFMLQNGVRINGQNTQEATSILHFLLPHGAFNTVHYSQELIEALLRAGLDLNIVLPDEGYSARQTSPTKLGEMLLSHALTGGHHYHLQDLIYHGIGEMDNDILLFASEIGVSGAGYKNWFEAFSLRDEMLEKMQKDIPSNERKAIQDLSLSEREKLAKLCHKTRKFRIACYNRNWAVDKEIEDRRDVHDAFINACIEGRLDEAEKLLVHDIDINASLVERTSLRWSTRDDFHPLLNHACLKGDVKLVEFLLNHGAKCNIGSSDEVPEWLPPILECAISNIPNKPQILALLLKAGADPNEKCINRFWGSHSHLHEAFFKTSANKRALLDELSCIGMDINLPDRDGKTWFDELYTSLSIDYDEDDYFVKIDEDQYTELATLLIYYGARVSEAQLRAINENEKFKPLRQAIKLHDRARIEFINDQLKELQALKPLSMDLINLITRYLNEELTPQENAQVARKITKN